MLIPAWAHQAVDVAEPLHHPAPENKWVIETEENIDIEGEPGALQSDARKNWKAACENWKQELHEDNKGSKFSVLDCGHPTCSGDVGSKQCVSKGRYKMKTREE
jgi:hypothetical protein